MTNIDLDIDKELREAEMYLNNPAESFLDNKKPKKEPPKNDMIKNTQGLDNNSILQDYQRRLKLFNFPDLGEITLSSIPQEQEKTLKFFDYIIKKKAAENQDFQKYRSQSDSLTKKCELLEFQVSKYEREIKALNEELKKNVSSKKENEIKLNKQKENYEKQIASIKNSYTYLTNKINKLTIDKRSIEEKYNKLSEAYTKASKSKIVNNVEIVDYVRQNDIGKSLSRLKGAEKLVEMLKNGYNESFRELLLEINCLKNFILEMHNDIKSLVDYPVEMNEEILNMPFLDCVSTVKMTFNKNLYLVRTKLGFNEGENNISDSDEIKITKKPSIKKEDNNKSGEQETIDKDFKDIIDSFGNNFDLNQNDKPNEEKDELPQNSKIDDVLNTSLGKEFEVLKNKWTKTLMSIENKGDIE